MTRLLYTLVAVALSATLSPAAPPAVSAVAYQPDGRRVAFGLYGEVRVFGDGGERGPVIKGLPGRVTALAYSLDSKWLAVASGEPGKSGAIRVYDPNSSGDPNRSPVATIAGHGDAVYALAFSPDGTLLATAGYDRVIHLWELPREWSANPPTLDRPRQTLKDHSDTVHALAFHPDGQLLASASADRTVKVWDPATGKRLYTLGEPTDWVYCVAWSPDKKHLAAGGVDKSLRVWAADRDGGRLVGSAFAHTAAVLRLAYGPGGKVLFTAGEDRVVKRWDTAKLTEQKVYGALPDAILDFAVSRDSQQFAVARFDGVGATYDADTGKPIAQPLPAATIVAKPAQIAPASGSRGHTVKVVVTGDELSRVDRVTANVPGVSVRLREMDLKQLTVDVTIGADAPVGSAQLVFENGAGKSSPLTFVIDRYPVVQEAGVTDSSRVGPLVNLPTTLIGRIDRAGDVDVFRFEAKAGQQVGVQLVAAEVGSKLDPLLVLTDASGQVLAEGTTALGYTIPTAGTYAIGIRDRDYRGAADMTYRLHVGDVPVVTAVFPLAVQRGRIARVHLDGVNLGPLAEQPVTVNVPASAMRGSRVPVPLPTGGAKPLGNPSVTVDEFATMVVDPTAGAELRLPGSADGILTTPGTGQTVRFAAKKGEQLIVEVLARRAGSPVDPVVEVLDAAGKPVPRATLRCTSQTVVVFRDHDSAGPGIRIETWSDLAINDYLYVDGELTRIFALPKNPDDDCQFYQVAGQRVGFLDTTPTHHAQGNPMYRVEIHPPGRTFPPNGLPVFTLFYRNDDGGPGYGKDSRVFFDPPSDGTYQVRVTDARGAGGPNHAYRVTVRPPRPDYAVTFSPTAPAVWKGGAIPVSVTAMRLDGFDGPIRVKLDGLPPGFSAPETFIEAGQSTTAFALHATPDATVPPNTQLKATATSTINGKVVVREVTGTAPKVVDPGDIVTTVRQDTIAIKPGEETRFVVDIERRGDFKGRVPLDVRGLPHGVRVLNIGLNGILITERDTSREIVLYAEPWVQPMEHPVVILARSERKNTEHAAKSVLLRVER